MLDLALNSTTVISLTPMAFRGIPRGSGGHGRSGEWTACLLLGPCIRQSTVFISVVLPPGPADVVRSSQPRGIAEENGHNQATVSTNICKQFSHLACAAPLAIAELCGQHLNRANLLLYMMQGCHTPPSPPPPPPPTPWYPPRPPHGVGPVVVPFSTAPLWFRCCGGLCTPPGEAWVGLVRSCACCR